MSSIFNGGLTCRSVIICEIIVHLLVVVHNNKNNVFSIVEIAAYRNVFQGPFIAFSVLLLQVQENALLFRPTK
jgi:hypothetical protein